MLRDEIAAAIAGQPTPEDAADAAIAVFKGQMESEGMLEAIEAVLHPGDVLAVLVEEGKTTLLALGEELAKAGK